MRMGKRRYIATLPGTVFGVGPFIRDVREQLMDFGLTGEALGMWRGIVLSAAVGITLWALWPDIVKVWKMLRGRKSGAEAQQVPATGTVLPQAKPPANPALREALEKRDEAKQQSDLADAKFQTALYRINALLGSAFAAPEDRDRKDEDQS